MSTSIGKATTSGPLFLLLIAMVSIQSGASLAKHLFPLLGAAGTTVLRLCFAAAMMLAIWRPWRYRLSRLNWQGVALYGAALGLMNFFFYLAVARIPLGIAVALEFTGPLAVALSASRRRQDFFWVGLAALGIFFLLPLQSTTASLDPLGVAYALLAALGWGAYIIFGKRASNGLPAGVVVSVGMSIGAVLVLPMGLAIDASHLRQVVYYPPALLVALLSSAIPYSLEMFALQRLPAASFSIMMSLEPAIGALSGLIWLGEGLQLQQGLAIVCIVVASCGSSVRVRRSTL